VWDAFLRAGFVPAYGTAAAWGSDHLYENEFIYSRAGRGWHLDRRAFDALLAAAAAERGVVFYTPVRALTPWRQNGAGWNATVQIGAGAPQDMAARFVVDATGRRAVFARAQGAQRAVLDRLAGVFMFFKAGAALKDSATLVEAWEDGWWYSARLPDSRLVVACMSDADRVQQRRLGQTTRWLACVAQTHYTRERLRQAVLCSRPTVHAAYSHHLDRVAGAGWLAVGDAAATFDPLSSQGIYKALRGGIYASYALFNSFQKRPTGLAQYAAILGEELAAYRATWAAYYQQERRWPDSPFWQRRERGQPDAESSFAVLDPAYT
jgi:flavin-dependent dehydrogenase